MRSIADAGLSEVGVDAVALKPAEMNLERARNLPVSSLVVDFEGREHVPAPETLRALAADRTVRLTVPVRADGYDPLGDDSALAALPADVDRVVVAGHPAYLSEAERTRAVAPRFRAAADRFEDPWIGTEGVERLALAVGGTQFELLSASTTATVDGLRQAGFDGEVAVYAPTVLSEDDDRILDAIGDYAARRPAVAGRLPDGTPTDRRASGRARECLREACEDYALVGSPEPVHDRVAELRAAGVDTVVAYPALGFDAVSD